MAETFHEDILETFLFCFLVSLGIIQIAAARRGWHGLSLYGGRVRANVNNALGAGLVIFGYAWYFSDPLHRNVRNIEALMSMVCLALGMAGAGAATAALASLAESLRRLGRDGGARRKSRVLQVIEFPEGKAMLSGSWGEEGYNLVVLAEPGRGSESILRALHAALPTTGGILSLHPRSGLGEGGEGEWPGEREMMRMLARLEDERGLRVAGETFLGLGWCANAALRLFPRLENSYRPRKLFAVAPVVPDGGGAFVGDSFLSNTPLDALAFLLRQRPWSQQALRRVFAFWLPIFLACAALATAVTVAFGVRWKYISGPAAGFLISLWLTYFLAPRKGERGKPVDAPLLFRARVPPAGEAPHGALVILTREEVDSDARTGLGLPRGTPEPERWRDTLRGKFLLGGGTAERLAALMWDGMMGDEEGGRT